MILRKPNFVPKFRLHAVTFTHISCFHLQVMKLKNKAEILKEAISVIGFGSQAAESNEY